MLRYIPSRPCSPHVSNVQPCLLSDKYFSWWLLAVLYPGAGTRAPPTLVAHPLALRSGAHAQADSANNHPFVLFP